VEQKQEKQKQKQEIEECRQGLCSNLEGWPDIEKTFLVKDKKMACHYIQLLKT
jgi:hypothetical protein